MKAKHVTVRSRHTASQRHALKAKQEAVIQAEAILGLALFLEPKVTTDCCRLMVASQQSHAAWKREFEREQVQHHFAAEFAAVNVVAQKHEAGVRRVSSDLKDAHQVEVLAVQVTHYSVGRVSFHLSHH